MYAYGLLQTVVQAWIMAAVLAMVLGGSQALSPATVSRLKALRPPPLHNAPTEVAGRVAAQPPIAFETCALPVTGGQGRLPGISNGCSRERRQQMQKEDGQIAHGQSEQAREMLEMLGFSNSPHTGP